jgi:hypothetical protein
MIKSIEKKPDPAGLKPHCSRRRGEWWELPANQRPLQIVKQQLECASCPMHMNTDAATGLTNKTLLSFVSSLCLHLITWPDDVTELNVSDVLLGCFRQVLNYSEISRLYSSLLYKFGESSQNSPPQPIQNSSIHQGAELLKRFCLRSEFHFSPIW